MWVSQLKKIWKESIQKQESKEKQHKIKEDRSFLVFEDKVQDRLVKQESKQKDSSNLKRIILSNKCAIMESSLSYMLFQLTKESSKPPIVWISKKARSRKKEKMIEKVNKRRMITPIHIFCHFVYVIGELLLLYAWVMCPLQTVGRCAPMFVWLRSEELRLIQWVLMQLFTFIFIIFVW